MAGKGNGNIRLIDPNDVVSRLPNTINGTPEYEKMFIFAELVATRRGRSSLLTTSVGTTQQRDGLENDITINMMGFDQDSKEFTTKWSKNTTLFENPYEGFGITSIDVKINSSFVPEINIEFTDIRGMAFANKGKDSPYAILFDFPPALFELTLKGYYGRSLTYDLHLVKYDVKFDANTGNFNTSTQFIARTFAPLTDVLFKYVEYFPLTNTGTALLPISTGDGNDNNEGSDDNQPDSVQSNPKKAPKNTHELIKTLEVLYDKIRKIRDNSELSQAYESSLKDFNVSENVANTIINFRNILEPDLREGSTLAIINEDVDVDADERYFRSINNLGPYNTIIQSFETRDVQLNTDEKLFILVRRSPEDINNNDSANNRGNRDNQIGRGLQTLRKSLLQQGSIVDDNINNSNTSNDIKPSVIDATRFLGIEINDSVNNIQYLGIDITVFYQKIYKFNQQKRQDVEGKRKELVDVINDIAKEELGWEKGPTIYNVFEVICNDIDTFFNTLKFSSKEGERHHEQYRNQIITNNPNGGIKDSKIGSYPRYAKLQVINNISKQVRRIPDLQAFPNVPKFPEVNLVDDFINTFVNIIKKEDNRNLRTQIDTSGNNVWIPVSPADSILYNELGYDSPYFNLNNQSSNTILSRIYEIVLNRYYIASQYTYSYNWYADRSWLTDNFENEPNKNNLINYVAGAEAVNLLNSISEENILFGLREASKLYSNNINGFYDELKQRNVTNFNQLGDTTIISESLNLTNGEEIYRRRDNENFNGFRILQPSTINEIRSRKEGDSTTESNETTNVVDRYLDSESSLIKRVSNFFTGQESVDEFTGENLSFFNDKTLDDDFDSNHLTKNFIEVWSDFLSEENNGDIYDLRFKEILEDNEPPLTATGYSREAKAFIVLSNMGYTVSVFKNILEPSSKQWKRYLFPALNILPAFVPAYIGGLIKYQNDSVFKDEIDRFFGSDDIGRVRGEISRGRGKIRLDAEKTVFLSTIDSDIFSSEFDDFVGDNDKFGDVKRWFIGMINLVNTNLTDEVDKKELYENALRNEYFALSNLLNQRYGILNTSQLTFYEGNGETEGFKPLSLITGGTTLGGENITSQRVIERNNIFFQEFFRVIGRNIEGRIDRVQDRDIDIRSSVQDEDIRTQTYYSFKSITDKWLAGQNNSVNGFPFNEGRNDSLIEKFMFVDRAMNPIGNECVIDVEPLLDMAKDYDLNVFNVLTRLLAHNGFEFFPLQNFMRFKENEWENSFKIFESANQSATPAFVCMYIGGTATTLGDDSSAFDDDGIGDLDNVSDLPDFNNTENINAPEFTIKRNPENYGYNEVRAFRVRYAEQNQSFFKNIQIDSREFPETNESLAILSKIAGDESASSPAPKGQNLFNIYENRSYSATAEMLGNMMIQPTQYFQLENIPIFSGAYMITSVGHSIKPNHATTTFNGVKILKYPNPIVTDFATVIGLQSGNATDTTGNPNLSTNPEVNFGSRLAEDLPEQARHDSMFTLQLKPEEPQISE